jgi:Helix-turn-helix
VLGEPLCDTRHVLLEAAWGRDIEHPGTFRAAERSRISQPALSRIELGGGMPDIETLQRLGRAMGVRFRIIVGDENAEQEENLLVSLTSRWPPS